MHPDDGFHPPTSDDPYWTETCWFTFDVPERRLSGQIYPFFRPNQGVCAGGVYLWDDHGDQPWNCVYGKNFWHLPIPAAGLDDIELPNGIAYRCVEPLQSYEVRYRDPDADEVEIDLRFDGLCPPNRLADSHLDQPGRYSGRIRIGKEELPVDAWGIRDRSWSVRDQFGADIHHSGATRGGYSYGIVEPGSSFHLISMAFDGTNCLGIHGHYEEGGQYARIASATRMVEARSREGCPSVVRIEGTDELERSFVVEGRPVNRLALHLNPNLFTWFTLMRWELGGRVAWGQDHDNWNAGAGRRFMREVAGPPVS